MSALNNKKKSRSNKAAVPAKKDKKIPAPPYHFGCMRDHGAFAKKILCTLAGVLMVYLIFYIGILISLNIKKYDNVGKADRGERTISVTGIGKVIGDNNIAVTTIGYSNTDKDVGKAQAENKKVMDQVGVELAKMGIEDRDIQSNYTIFPDYDYSKEGTTLKGYKVTNSLTIKIRDLTKINKVLSLAGKYGANEVGGLNFTINDPSILKELAREKALRDGQKKALVLANLLGVRLGGIVTYNEYDSIDSTYYKYGGVGGAGAAPAVISAGSKDVVVNVNMIYEILPKK